MAIIEVKNLSKIYYEGEVETPALNGVSFSIEEGEFVAIMGPSGSGKSTLLHVLGFLDKHTSGNYQFKGKSVNKYSKDEMARVRNKEMGFVFQTFNLLARTPVLENVKLPLLYSDVSESSWDKRAKKAIEMVGLSHRLQHEPSQLSGGEKQRVAIARALVLKPTIIFADEPTGNLDSKSGEIIIDTLQQLNDEGHTILLITHETHTSKHAKRRIFLRDGMIEKDDLIKNRLIAKDHFKK